MRSYAKINLAMDVIGIREDGYHEVETVMQQISLFDEIEIDWIADDKDKASGDPEKGKLNICLSTNKPYLPTDERNLAYKAALLMAEYVRVSGRPEMSGTLKIHIDKRIPVAAGLAGGSGNGAAVIIGLNRLWELGLDTRELCAIGKELGSDVPFMILVQNSRYSCALGTGRGEVLTPVSRDLDMNFLLAKPKFGVSTKEVYKGIDEAERLDHPDCGALIDALMSGDTAKALGNMGNMLEAYTLNAYPEVRKLKDMIGRSEGARFALMSGSGPTVIGFYDELSDARRAAGKFRELGYESFYAGNMRRVRGKR